jgi:3-hydroxybutyryl-CoA dehydrogenase
MTQERVAIAGSGAIACGLAATVAASGGEVWLLARSDDSAERALTHTTKLTSKLPDITGVIQVTTKPDEIADATYVVEAVVEDPAAKQALYATLPLGEDTILATTTSSLNVTQLAAASGRSERFAALHVFNPVPRMKLVAVAFPDGVAEDTRTRTLALCEALGKTAVEVPDTPGFVVNRLLFPYLFEAVELMERTGLSPEAIDTSMTLGAGHPMGPLALLDFVGLDVSCAIGDSIGVPPPQRLRDLVAEGALGRKTKRGLLDYSG